MAVRLKTGAVLSVVIITGISSGRRGLAVKRGHGEQCIVGGRLQDTGSPGARRSEQLPKSLMARDNPH